MITETIEDPATSGTNTPAGEQDDDFFSSWDKPTIKRPSNPPSRAATPGINRTASPFLNANGNGPARAKSPLSASEEGTAAAVPAPRAVPAAAIRKTATAGTAKKTNILGAKKKLGAKKVDASALDFDAAEKKAKEEQDRIEKLGYDPDADAPPPETAGKVVQPETSIVSPQPVNPSRGGFGATTSPRERSNSDMERLGMGVRKLGFGQVIGGGAPASSKAKSGGFGSTSRPAQGE